MTLWTWITNDCDGSPVLQVIVLAQMLSRLATTSGTEAKWEGTRVEEKKGRMGG
jgi:hypothetical protein